MSESGIAENALPELCNDDIGSRHICLPLYRGRCWCGAETPRPCPPEHGGRVVVLAEYRR